MYPCELTIYTSGSLELPALITSPSLSLKAVKLTNPREIGVGLLVETTAGVGVGVVGTVVVVGVGVGVGVGVVVEVVVVPPPPPPPLPPPVEPQLLELGVITTVFVVVVVFITIDDLSLEQEYEKPISLDSILRSDESIVSN